MSFIKKRYIILGAAILMIVFGSVIAYTRPVLPFIQLPGEVYPHTEGLFPEFLFNGTGFTNTFASTLLAWLFVIIIIIAVRARSRTADEVPTGFYNFFEMIVEGAYNFAEGIAGPRVREFFPWFMSFILIILLANWSGLIPGFDSIGLWEHKPHFIAEKAAKELKTTLAAEGLKPTDEEVELLVEETVMSVDEANEWDLRDGLFLIRADGNVDPAAPIITTEEGYKAGRNPEAADWTIVPFFRPAATDLNFTLAFALVAMIMVQFYGFKHLGGGYLTKFFPFAQRGWIDSVKSNPIKVIDPFVGLLELVSEFSKILSFSFRLLGNIFAGMVLLFVMAFILSVLNIAFFGLEFFVGLIQAVVFGLLTLIFMNSATEHHGDEEHH